MEEADKKLIELYNNREDKFLLLFQKLIYGECGRSNKEGNY